MPFALPFSLRRRTPRIDEDQVLSKEWPVQELALTAVWVLFAAGWDWFSANQLDRLYHDPVDSPGLQAASAFNFILTTGLVLYAVLRRSFHRRRRALEALRLNEERFEVVATASTDAVWDWDLATQAIWCNDGLLGILGAGPGSRPVRFEDLSARVHPDDRERVTGGLRSALGEGRNEWSGEYRLCRLDGGEAEVLDRVRVIRDAAGRPLRVVGALVDVTEQRRASRALEASQRELRALSARLQSAREEERSRIAREIHDELGQTLTAVKLDLDWLERRLEESGRDPGLNPWLDRVVQAGEVVESAMDTVRRIASDLRPTALDTLGLTAALREEVERFRARTGLECVLESEGAPADPPPELATAVFRILQESLTNVARHAQASAVSVRIARDARGWTLEVRDNGRGIDPSLLGGTRSLGLLGMRERVAGLGGSIEVGRLEPSGTRVRVVLPWPAETVAAAAPIPA